MCKDCEAKVPVEDRSESPLCVHPMGESTRQDWDNAYGEFLNRARALKMCSTCATTGALYLAMHAGVTSGMTEEDAIDSVRRIYRDISRQVKTGIIQKQD